MVYEQRIFNQIEEIIQNAREFVVLDLFLFNDDYDRKNSFPNLSERLTKLLVQQKEKYPNLQMVFITDEINTFYGAYPSRYLEQMKENGIQVVQTDLNQLRDPNPLYSGFWRLFHLENLPARYAMLPNPFSPDSPKVTIRSYLKLLNFKANHRKVVITENQALVTSLNPHDASGYHSNIAMVVNGPILQDLLASENAVIRFSGGQPVKIEKEQLRRLGGNVGTHPVRMQLITEGKIKSKLIKEIKSTKEGDRIRMAMFYLGDHQVVKELVYAAIRNVEIQLILDANKDAFGLEKNGIPNRPVASELVKQSAGKIKIKWYSTHGEQFHSKMTVIENAEEMVVIAGSANLTRRNIGDYNLETNIKAVLPKNHKQSRELRDYFDRIWNNEDVEYTLDFTAYQDDSLLKKLIYHVQEKTGLSTF